MVLVSGLMLLSAAGVFGSPSGDPAEFDRSGIDGSGQASMQPVNTGVRVALVAAVPGSPTKEAWAIGRSTAKVPGWAGEEGGGQTVFLQYTAGSGWRIVGPPVDASGRPVNPGLTSLSMAADGQGWAVGDQGALARRDGSRWVTVERPDGLSATLKSVSVGIEGGRTFGYAVGEGPVVLRMDSGRWFNDTRNLSVPSGENWDLLGVSAVDGAEAWAAGASSGAALVLRRTSGGWARVRTGEALFDEPGTRRVGASVVVSTTARSVSATRDGAWVGGTIAPVDAGASFGDPAGDATRPFALYFRERDGVTTYCPFQYSMAGDRASRSAVCEQPLPLSGFGLVSLQAFRSSGEVFAGGLGLFHYRDGAWFREPNPIGFLSSVSFSSPVEGWVAGPGDAYGASGSASSIGTLGHWTKSPRRPSMARWPEPVTDSDALITHPLEAVAVAPDGSGRAQAVGQNGAMLLYRPEVGWDSLPIVSPNSLHALAWPQANRAWAVGGLGTILRYDGRAWTLDHMSNRLTLASIFGVAFSGTRGYAVGANGLILRHEGGTWVKDPASSRLTSDDLYAVAAAGEEFVAVGAGGTVLVTKNGAWSRQGGLEPILSRGGQLPTLYAVAGLPDGTAVAGGELSTLVRRDGAGGSWRVEREGDRVPPEGTILAIAASRTGGVFNLMVSVSYEQLKYSGDGPAAVTGFVLHGTPAGWRDLGLWTRLTAYPAFDASAAPDPVYSIALEGSQAWAVGGTGVGNDDGQGHTQLFPTSSIYRIDLAGDPAPVGNTVTPILETDDHLITFAFFGETWCGRGLCSPTMGTGTKADVVASQIQREINSMSKLPGGLKFVLFGGDMRRTGIPEELGEFKRYADGFAIPFYAAMGPLDLFGGFQQIPVDDDVPFNVFIRGAIPSGPTDDSFYLNTFRDRPAPWGTNPQQGFQPVSLDVQPAENRCGENRNEPCARTHYAFDYVKGGKRLRIAVLDNSVLGRFTNASSQNPPQDQRAWLNRVLEDARNRNAATIVVLNTPLQDPLGGRTGNPEITDVQSLAAQAGASAVLASNFRENAVDVIKVEGVASTVPVFVFGGGGAPLESSPGFPPNPSRGYYHSWQFVSVNFDPERRSTKPLGQAEVYVHSFPVVDSVSIHAIDGVTVRGGNTLRFTGSGRAPDGGSPDPLQSKAVVVPLDLRSRGVCTVDITDNNRPKCSGTGPVGPSYRFVSEDPSIGFFVRPDLIIERLPALDGFGRLVPDPSSGLFCAVGPGTAYVNLISGFHRARMQVTVTGGSGPCRKDVPGLPPRILTEPALAPLPRSVFYPSLAPPAPEIQSFALVPPPPVWIVAPAPPAAGGYARREQHEEAKEEQGSSFTAIRQRSRYEAANAAAWFALGAGSLGILLAAAIGGAVRVVKARSSSLDLSEFRKGRVTR